MTVLVHGEDEHRRAVELTEALFGGGELSRFDPERLEDALSSAMSVEAKDGDTYAALLVGTELAKSNSDAQRLAASGSLSANDRPIEDIFASPVRGGLPGRPAARPAPRPAHPRSGHPPLIRLHFAGSAVVV